MDAEAIWACLETRAVAGNIAAFVGEFVERMVKFVDQHPAFLPLLDAPLATRPVGPRNRLRKQMERVLKVLRAPACPRRRARPSPRSFSPSTRR